MISIAINLNSIT